MLLEHVIKNTLFAVQLESTLAASLVTITGKKKKIKKTTHNVVSFALYVLYCIIRHRVPV